MGTDSPVARPVERLPGYRSTRDVELRRAVDGGELPEPERVAVDYQLGILVGRLESLEEREQLIEELDVFELLVAADAGR